MFAIGLEEDTNLKYIGLQINQSQNLIKLSTSSYSQSLCQINLESKIDKDLLLSKEQSSLLKKLCGQLNWLCTQSRPDICYENCIVGNCQKGATIRNIVYANKVVRKLHSTDLSLYFYGEIDLYNCNIVTFCDASFGNLSNGGSQGGFISFIVDNKGVYCPVAWQSRRIRRVVKSTLGAECLSAVDAAEASVLISLTLKNIIYGDTSNEIKIPICIICDNRSLVQTVHSSTTTVDKRLIIDISILREMVEKNEINEFRWVSTDFQIANSFTKQGANSNYLVNVLSKPLRFNFNTAIFE